MKYLYTILLVFAVGASASAQGFLPGPYVGMPYYTQALRSALPNDSLQNKKWSVQKFSALTMGITAFRGGSATFASAPLGLQLTRKLNNNVYAFGAISAAPTYVNFNQAFMGGNNAAKQFGSNTFMYQPNQFYMGARAEVGLMYTNDERTFQISGSIGIERRQVPVWGSVPPQNMLPAAQRHQGLR